MGRSATYETLPFGIESDVGAGAVIPLKDQSQISDLDEKEQASIPHHHPITRQ